MPKGIKNIYFIRHGETKRNRQYIHQGPEEPLTALGRSKTEDLIGFLQDKQIDTVISSNMLRSIETAQMVAEAFNLPFRQEKSVREFSRPLKLYDRHYFSPVSIRYAIDLFLHRIDLLWNEEGGENLVHIRERVRDARLMLEKETGQNVVVISHRIFMTMFTETVCYDKPLSLWKFFQGLLGLHRIPNTGILHFCVESSQSEENKCTWFLNEVLVPPYNSHHTKS